MEEKRFITMRHFIIKKKIVPLRDLEDSLLWLDGQKGANNNLIRNIPQHNHESLLHHYNCIAKKTTINEETYHNHLQAIRNNESYNIPFNEHQLTTKYNELLDENIKNLTALKTFLEISLLENPILEFSQKVSHISTNITDNLSTLNGVSNSRTTQKQSEMVSNGLVKSWEWVEGMVRCAVLHVKHASKHCQFHSELHSLIRGLKEEANKLTSTDQAYNDSCSSALRLAKELKTKTEVIRVLGERVEGASVEAMQLVPIRLRTQASKLPLQAIVICDYITHEVQLKAGDEVEVVDRSNMYKWGVVVKDKKSEMKSPVVIFIPSILLVVAGTDNEIQESVDLMYEEHRKMVRGWRRVMEGRLVKSMGHVFKRKYSHVEELLIQTLSPEAKKDLTGFFSSLKEALAAIKEPELAFEANELSSRLDYINKLMDVNLCSQNEVNQNGIRGRVLVVQLNTLRLLLNNFKDFTETCNTSLAEVSKMKRASKGAYKSVYCFNKSSGREQDDMISVQNVIRRLDHIITQTGIDWRQIQYSEDRLRNMSDKEFLEHIKDLSNFVEDYETQNLDKENEKLHLNYACNEELNELIDELVVGNDEDFVEGKVKEEESEEEEEEREGVKISETEHMYAAECEVNKKFVITGVLDPVSKQEISLAQAIKTNVLDAKNGNFLVDAVTMKRISIAEAMVKKLIKVQSTEVKKSNERKLSVGVVTIKTTHHVSKQRKQSLVDERSVLVVMDLKTGRQLSWRQAFKEGIIDKNTFIDTRDYSTHTLDQAEHNGWIKRSRVSSPSNSLSLSSSSIHPPDVIPEVKTITYAVRQVKDLRSGKMLSFIDACREGLFDRNSALFFDLLSCRKHSIEEAIQLGYVQAEQVTDCKSIQLWEGAPWL